ncbi:unnamed protein product [Musa acuminata subsp. malaccensis]|uniref:(wild Malaysian banana) hypothetical protein n=1 Tax=Musa acuminata subsp. malaccensis TaxID=214687 RepID=A0A804KKB9_MUSAM|nr:PREDICTED: putative SWI/SNF-related matrix-associated actin-dependent regulator of chromatin subfamily A member 3-like 1 [Musa acuminata subsp. malaccensis]CAG1835407.1 unnamed protein product [Musa acuminata subsp. malaccensis]
MDEQEEQQLWRRLIDDDDYDAAAAAASAYDSQEHPSDAVLVGFVIANIVGLRYYTGTISGREMVGLVREPLNPYDPNAIKVLNTRTVQVGHIERAAAAALAPLLDSCLVSVEAIVPKPPSKNRNPYRLPCQIHLFARPDAIPVVRAAVFEGGLQLIEYDDHEFGLSEAAIVQEENSKKSKSGKHGKSVDKIFALVGKGDEGKIAPLKPPKEVIVSELFEHQKEGLGWLVGRENSCDLPPFWEMRDGSYVNVLTNHQTSERPEPLKGGIFADDMGLGKTLTLLSLIATNKPGGFPSSSTRNLQGEDERINSSRGRKSRSGKTVVKSCKRRKLDDGEVQKNEALGLKTTLVVCPLSVLTSWITQLEEHTRPRSMKVYLYHGERTREPEELLKYDIVMTTYTTLSAEFGDLSSPMKETEWFRVILDEAHVIKNFGAQQTKAVIALKAERRWVVTGTPIQNSSFDLFSLMAFLRFQPFSIKSYWQNLVQRPLDQGSKSGLSRLQALVGTISLRRTKAAENGSKGLVGLPSKTIETCFVELSAEEREQYDRLETEAQNTIREYIDADTVLHNYSTVLHIILRLRQICNDVALCPSDIKLFLPSNALEDVSQNPELLKKLASLVEDGDDFDCPVCLSPPLKTVITCCAHIFCQACILKTLKHLNASCPICRHPLSKTDLFVVPPTKSTNDDGSKTCLSNRPLSSKVSFLLKLLLASKEQNPSTKSVVFSQFRKMLILLQEPLKDAGFVILRLDGTMSTKRRAEVIKRFGKCGPGEPTVLLASLKAAGTGINLTAASRVYLMEPWWNPAVEEQAMDRVHRIGQKEEVKVVRLIVRGSIEERILKLQERKKKLASGAFGRKAAKEQKQVRLEDLRIMMHL